MHSGTKKYLKKSNRYYTAKHTLNKYNSNYFYYSIENHTQKRF